MTFIMMISGLIPDKVCLLVMVDEREDTFAHLWYINWYLAADLCTGRAPYQ